MSRLDFCRYELVDDCYDWNNDNCDKCNIFKAYCEGEMRAKNSIVRCKDCRWYKYDSYCSKTEAREIDADNFCSYGERRKNV